MLTCSYSEGAIKNSKSIAINVAQAQFLKQENSSDLKNFEAIFIEHADNYEVVFVPHLPPKELGIPMKFGGSTIYGREVHYFVEKETYKIISRRFAK